MVIPRVSPVGGLVTLVAWCGLRTAHFCASSRLTAKFFEDLPDKAFQARKAGTPNSNKAHLSSRPVPMNVILLSLMGSLQGMFYAYHVHYMTVPYEPSFEHSGQDCPFHLKLVSDQLLLGVHVAIH